MNLVGKSVKLGKNSELPLKWHSSGSGPEFELSSSSWSLIWAPAPASGSGSAALIFWAIASASDIVGILRRNFSWNGLIAFFVFHFLKALNISFSFCLLECLSVLLCIGYGWNFGTSCYAEIFLTVDTGNLRFRLEYKGCWFRCSGRLVPWLSCIMLFDFPCRKKGSYKWCDGGNHGYDANLRNMHVS